MKWYPDVKNNVPGVTMKTVILCLGLALVGQFIVKIFYSFRLSPLRHVPGPFLAKVTDKWALWLTFSGNRARIMHRMHQKYGSVVQVSPTELSFSSLQAIETIHGQNTVFPKADFYKLLGEPSLFNFLGISEHKERRRLLNHVFSQQLLNDLEPAFDQSLRKLTAVIDEHEDKAVDIKHLFKCFAVDNAGEIFLGRSFQALSSKETPKNVKDFDLLFLSCFVTGFFPLTAQFLRKLQLPKVEELLGAMGRFYKYGADCLQQYIATHGRVSRRKDLLTKLIGKHESDPNALPDKDISVELINFCSAATDTSAITLIYLFWELGRNPDLTARIRQELTDIPLNDGAVKHVSLGSCSFLEAALTESMRMHPAVTWGLPRETPPGGAVVDGVYVPEGTVVSTNTWSVHYDAEHFRDPYKYDPTRWLGEVPESMKARWLPFSKGPYNCIGQQLALFQFRILIATLVKKYHISIDEKMTEGSLDFNEYFLAIPKCEKCLIKFTPVKT